MLFSDHGLATKIDNSIIIIIIISVYLQGFTQDYLFGVELGGRHTEISRRVYSLYKS